MLKIWKGTNGRWGIGGGGVLYEAGFCKRTAQRIADLENSEKPPKDWEHTGDILEKEGCNTEYRE